MTAPKNIKPRVLLKSFGYGIFLAEMVPAPTTKTRPNGTKSAAEHEVCLLLASSGIMPSNGPVEALIDHEDAARAFIMVDEGHAPTKYELAQISDEDWEKIRTVVDIGGTQSFKDRVTMLEERRVVPTSAASPAHP